MAIMPKYIVFTDASQRNRGDRKYCGFGVVLLNTETRQYTEFGAELAGHSVWFGEAWAVYRGIIAVRDLVDGKDTPVLVVSDNKMVVDIFDQYIPDRIWDVSVRDFWLKKNGDPVKDSRLYQRILDLINDNENLNIKFIHINSHLPTDEWYYVREKLSRYGVKLNVNSSLLFMKMNGRADKIATSITAKMKAEEESGHFIRMIPRNDYVL